MGIFSRSDKVAESGGASVISSGAKIVGQLSVKDSFYVDGEIEGDITSDSVLTVGKNGSITGKVIAKSAIIGGKINGKVDCDSCEILSGGKIEGEVHSISLVIEAGGMLEGYSYVKNGGRAKEERVGE